MTAVRDEQPADSAAIRAVNDAAFDQPLEGRIVDAPGAHGAVRLSLVAEVDGRVVGHILFSPVTSAGGAEGLGLGPMAVTPEHQRRGVGGGTDRWPGLTRLRAVGFSVRRRPWPPRRTTRASVLCRPAATAWRCEWDVPDESFMVHVLDPELRRPAAAGLIRYRPEFRMVMLG